MVMFLAAGTSTVQVLPDFALLDHLLPSLAQRARMEAAALSAIVDSLPGGLSVQISHEEIQRWQQQLRRGRTRVPLSALFRLLGLKKHSPLHTLCNHRQRRLNVMILVHWRHH